LDQQTVSYEAKLREMGYEIEPANLNAGKIMLATREGKLIFTSGHVSQWKGETIKGKVGKDLTVEEGYRAARIAALSCLSSIKTLAGSLDHIDHFVKLFGMVNVAPDFDNTPAVIHGASELLLEVFGEAGRHARSAIGLTVPVNFAVEIEMIVALK
jgi:enamine deaminase RidA (YjgF/YER057c/UK114 family)